MSMQTVQQFHREQVMETLMRNIIGRAIETQWSSREDLEALERHVRAALSLAHYLGENS